MKIKLMFNPVIIYKIEIKSKKKKKYNWQDSYFISHKKLEKLKKLYKIQKLEKL